MANVTTTDYNAFLRDPDQASREAELRDFIGPNAEAFLPVYRKMLPGPDGKPQIKFFGGGFVACAFFCGPVWFFYRKMWAVAWSITGLLVLIVILSSLFPNAPLSRLGFILSIVLASSAKKLYVTTAIQRLGALRRATGILDPVAVQRDGGVSTTAAWVSGTIFGIFYLLGLIGIIYLIAHGVSPT